MTRDRDYISEYISGLSVLHWFKLQFHASASYSNLTSLNAFITLTTARCFFFHLTNSTFILLVGQGKGIQTGKDECRYVGSCDLIGARQN